MDHRQLPHNCDTRRLATKDGMEDVVRRARVDMVEDRSEARLRQVLLLPKGCAQGWNGVSDHGRRSMALRRRR